MLTTEDSAIWASIVERWPQGRAAVPVRVGYLIVELTDSRVMGITEAVKLYTRTLRRVRGYPRAVTHGTLRAGESRCGVPCLPIHEWQWQQERAHA